MASISRDPNGRRRILFVAGDGSRKTIRLGKCSQKQAEAAKVKIEALIGSRLTGTTADDEVSRWLADLPDDMYGKLIAVGLAKPRVNAPDASVLGLTLGRYLDDYRQSRVDVKPGTQLTYGRTRHYLLAYFGADKLLSQINEGDADAWRLDMLGQGLALNTVNRACGMARQFFRAAVRRKLLMSNPFADLQSSVKGNKAREYFVTRETAEKILAACPNTEWKLIFALARYGGLRTPSETLLLRWSDINWDAGKMLVHSPKTEAHAGGESRFVPIFPELDALLTQAMQEAEPGDGFVIAKHRKSGLNLRTHLLRIMAKAGVKPWPKLFQNMRSTRQTELCERWPEHIVCAWIGNSRLVAREHYLQVRDEDFLRATQPGKAAQNPAQQPSADPCKPMQTTPAEVTENAVFQGMADDCRGLQSAGMGGAGFEPATSCV
jgi:integrase